MPYFCLIDLSASSVPHMEFLEAETRIEAEAEARTLAPLHSSATGVRVFGSADEAAGDDQRRP
ncbi:hypothetical protein RSD66_04000 [Brevundimonas sp. S1H14]|uniref:hypothetical protein n=1 Tax=Brevundimonas sp. S1H14 TaxID=3078084 RepID=UPI0039E7B021